MSFVKNDSQQFSLNDNMFHLTQREINFLNKSWAKVFAENIFPAIDEDDFACLYSDSYSRPNTPVNVIIGALILKEVLGITDDELVQALMFDIRYQYALHTTSFDEQPLSDRTLSRFRARCLAYETETGIDLIHQCVVKLSKEISDFMKISPGMQRMDSLMVAAHIRNLSLLELFYTCVSNLAKIMEQRNIPIPQMQKHYIMKDDYNAFIYHKKELDITERTLLVMKDGEQLLALCNGGLDDTSEYQLLIRLLKEQTVYDDHGNRRLRKKEEFENPSKNLMNPSDPEATFRSKAGKKHIGYVGNITETVDSKKSIVTDYAYEQNTYSNSQFLKDYLCEQPVASKKIILVTDGAYYGEGNHLLAKKHGHELVTTNFTGRKPEEIFADFIFSEDQKALVECVNHVKPTYTHYDERNERSIAHYKKTDCMECPYKEQCRPRFTKNYAFKEVSYKTASRAKYLRYMGTKEFKKYGNFRNGVEAIPSLLRRKYHVDTMPVRGKKQTRLYFGFKIAALNFQKLLEYNSSQNKCAQKDKAA